MPRHTLSRSRQAAIAACLSVCVGAAWGQHGRPAAPPPPRPQGGQSRLAPIQRHENPGARNAPRGEHLAEWMTQHNSMSTAEQQRALNNEPGFKELPSQTQQRMHERLNQLNQMTPQQRERTLQRNEAMEHLTPDQRGQVRGAMQQLAGLPQDQRRYVARSFRELRELPADQRASAMSRMPLNDAQRAALNSLMRVEPMLPPQEAAPRQ